MEIECQNSIVELHVFIESWLRGSVENTKQRFQYFDDALDKDFVIIHPGGDIQTKPDIIKDLWEAYGVKSENFTITIRDIKIRYISESICILNYIELQTGAENSARISTVTFQKSLNNRDYSWFHLHETWRPSKYYIMT